MKHSSNSFQVTLCVGIEKNNFAREQQTTNIYQNVRLHFIFTLYNINIPHVKEFQIGFQLRVEIKLNEMAIA